MFRIASALLVLVLVGSMCGCGVAERERAMQAELKAHEAHKDARTALQMAERQRDMADAARANAEKEITRLKAGIERLRADGPADADPPATEAAAVEGREIFTRPIILPPNAVLPPSLKVNEVLFVQADVLEVEKKQQRGDFLVPAEGYSAALDRVTQSLIRQLREQPLLVVWLFDESASMRDDQAEIRDKVIKVYQELNLLGKNLPPDSLLSAVVGFGKDVHFLSRKPVADVGMIKQAIDAVAIDKTGEEKMCFAVSAVLNKYAAYSNRSKRKIIVVIVTDESGDDGQHVEQTLASDKRLNASIYVLGRQAVLGLPFAHVRWKDPVFGLFHWLPIRRGPETAFPELLQFDGFGPRRDGQRIRTVRTVAAGKRNRRPVPHVAWRVATRRCSKRCQAAPT